MSNIFLAEFPACRAPPPHSIIAISEINYTRIFSTEEPPKCRLETKFVFDGGEEDMMTQ